jgi:glycosyltransferase involved in cell wall biosynthesis
MSHASAPTVAIILPAFNEEATIGDTIRSFAAQLPDACIWVVDNNSRDATAQVACETIATLRLSGGVLEEPAQGKGNAVRRAFREVEADIYVLADADLTYPADQVRELIAPVEAGLAEMAVGDRLSGGHYQRENKRRFHGFGNRLVRWLVNWTFNATLVDIMSGYRALSRRFVKTYPILVAGFEIETDMTLHALDKRLAIREVPIRYRDRPPGSMSKLNTFRDGARVIFTITSVLRCYRPLLFFMTTATVVASAGLLAAVPVMQDWFRERYIHHVPLAILATGLEIVAIVLAAVGLILDSITQQDKRRFERQLLQQAARR